MADAEGSAAPRPASARELQAVLGIERLGAPFVLYRGAAGELHSAMLEGEVVDVGRRSSCAIPLAWDSEVSRWHFEFRRGGDRWGVYDGGLNRNGTYVNGRRVREAVRLSDGDLILAGATQLQFRDPRQRTRSGVATIDSEKLAAPELTRAQAQVLAALCAPILAEPGRLSTPATNQEIAAEVHLSVDAVKGHLRVLFRKFGLDGLPQNQKRLALADCAILAGMVGSGA